ncbi:MAG: efflux RND transporter periplasmic adaptor subunit [Armatimonadetes bacterium]|nr:efflux RND transporter periplasmic adaptor subunit [Armatimonadota bacterium]
MARFRWGILFVILAVGAFLFFRRGSTLPTVEVLQPTTQNVTRTLAVTGQVEAISSANISTQINGILVKRVLVDKGNRVKKGQPLIELDDRELQALTAKSAAQVKQAEASLLRAKAQMEGSGRSVSLANEALTDSLDLKNQRDNMATNVKTAKERVAQSREALARTREGAKRQTVRSAGANLRRAESQLRFQVLALNRAESLFRQGAISQEARDLARTNHEIALEAVNSAREDMSQLSEPRTEDVRQAEAVLREAEAAVQGAETMLSNSEKAYRNRTNLRLNLSSTQTEQSVNRAAYLNAQADLQRTYADAEQTRAQLSRTVLFSPVEGVVTDRQVEPGETVSAGKTLLSIVEPRNLRVRADVDETNLKDIALGQEALLRPDALPDLKIRAKIDEIMPSANIERGTVEVRLKLNETPDKLLPHLTIDVNIITGVYDKARTIPRASVLNPDTNATVFVVENGEIKSKGIQITGGDVGQVVVLKGLSDADKVVVNPRVVKEGAKVEPHLASQEKR